MAASTKRTTVYFGSDLQLALKHKAAETSRSVSDLVNEAVQYFLAEDADDLASFEDRGNEPLIPYEDLLLELRADSRL